MPLKRLPTHIYYHQTQMSTLLATAGNAASNVMSSHLLKIGNDLNSDAADDTKQFIQNVVERLVRPFGEETTETTAKRSRTQDDLAHSTEAILIEIVRRDLTQAQLVSDLTAVGVVDGVDSLVSALFDVINDRKKEIRRALAKKTSVREEEIKNSNLCKLLF